MTRHFKTLDAMRGIAAIAVLMLHISKLFNLPYLPRNAHMAVDFFFMLSGFVVAGAYESRLVEGWPFLAFVRKRIIRLYPMILAGGCAGIVMLSAQNVLYRDLGWLHVALVAIPNFLLLPSPALLGFRPFGFLLDSPFWSLSCEMFINLIYAVVISRIKNPILFGLLAVSAFALFALSHYFQGIDVGFNWTQYWCGLVRVVFPFFAGVAINRLVKFEQSYLHLQLPTMAVLFFVLAGPLAVPGVLQSVLVIFIFPAILIFGASASPTTVLRGVWRWLGELSYPLYAIHYPIVVIMAQLTKAAHHTGWQQWSAAALCAAVAVAIAHFVLVLFDQPLRKWLERAVPQPREPLPDGAELVPDPSSPRP